MALGPGTRLGPYEVTAPIGEGGMGEVYKGHGRFLVIGDNSTQAEVLTVIQGWFEELKRLVPVK